MRKQCWQHVAFCRFAIPNVTLYFMFTSITLSFFIVNKNDGRDERSLSVATSCSKCGESDPMDAGISFICTPLRFISVTRNYARKRYQGRWFKTPKPTMVHGRRQSWKDLCIHKLNVSITLSTGERITTVSAYFHSVQNLLEVRRHVKVARIVNLHTNET